MNLNNQLDRENIIKEYLIYIKDVKNYSPNTVKSYKSDINHYIKNTQGGAIARGALEIANYASSRVILTGTPAPNGYEDLSNFNNKAIIIDKDNKTVIFWIFLNLKNKIKNVADNNVIKKADLSCVMKIQIKNKRIKDTKNKLFFFIFIK